jgi:predicted nucleic acid-binding protein
LADFTAYHLSHGLGLLDALIAACAIGRAATLLTFNAKHYKAVPGLVIAEPYTR